MAISFSQIEPPDGLRSKPPRVWALTNCTIYTEPSVSIENGILIIRDGFIEKVGKGISIPKDATRLNLHGATVYPGFIESWLPISTVKGLEKSKSKHWNYKVHPSLKASDYYVSITEELEKLHKLGFTSAHIVPDTGIFRGQSDLVQLNDKSTILETSIAQIVSYEVDGWGSDKYPNALLGVIALIRQTILDGDWYGIAKGIIDKYPIGNEPIKENIDLEAVSHSLQRNQPFIFETKDEVYALRSNVLAEEFGIKHWLKGNGFEYRRLNEMKKSSMFVILPLNFPNKPNVNEYYQELSYTTAQLKHWDMAPDNPTKMLNEGMNFSITSADLKVKKDFRKNLIRSIQRGFPKSDALSALTTIPAKYMGVEDRLGKIKPGYIANLTIVDGDYFNEQDLVTSVWVGGEEISLIPKLNQDFSGEWELESDWISGTLKITKNESKYSGKIISDTLEIKLDDLETEGAQINWKIKIPDKNIVFRFFGFSEFNIISGKVFDITGLSKKWNAKIIKTSENKKNLNVELPSSMQVFYPEGAYGIEFPLKKEKNIIIKNTTIWTCGIQGILQDHDILFSNGKIKKLEKI